MAFRDFGNPPLIASEGEKTNPAADTLMADTGALRNRSYEVRVVFAADAPASFRVERRNAANGANVGATTIVRVPANSAAQTGMLFRVEVGERVRVVMHETLAAGHASATLQAEVLT